MFTSASRALDGRGAGWLLLLFTATVWGLNWPVIKFLLTEVPPMTSRAWCGALACGSAALLAASRGERLRVPAAQVPRLALLALLNVTAWMGLTGFSVVWLPASEAVTYAYTMPIWAAMLAWPVLGERPGLKRCAGLLFGFAGVLLLAGGGGAGAVAEKLPGVLCVLGAGVLFALGTVLSKRLPVALSPVAMVAWQFGLGCLPLVAASLLLESAEPIRLTGLGWAALLFNGVVALFLAYLSWFAALRRLPAGLAATGTLISPLVGVFASALALGEPLGWRQLAALAMTLTGVALAARG